MKNKIFSIMVLAITASCFAVAPLTLKAQEDEFIFGPRRERMEAMRTAFITRKTNFTRAEAAVFWPVYNEYQDAMFGLNKNKEFNLEDYKQIESLSDAEAEKLLNAYLKIREDAMQLRITFLKDIRTVLPARKVVLYLQAERQFNRELLRKVQQ